MNKKILLIIPAISMLITSCSFESEKPSMLKKNQEEPIISESEVHVNKHGDENYENKPVYLYPSKNEDAYPFRPVFDVLNLKYLSAKKLSEILSRIAPDSVSVEGERGSQLVLKTRSSDMSDIKNLIDSIDKPSPQIMIESRIVEISESGLKNLGLSWGNNGGNFKISVNKDDGKITLDNISAILNALISKGEARLVANPRISTLDNNEANVNIGSKVPYAVPVSQNSATTQWTVQYIDAGVSLKITPRMGQDGLITVKICPEVSSISEWRSTQAGEFPVISTRNAQTQIRVKNGQTIVIGGLIDESFRENVSKIPGFGEIPLAGALFSKKTSEKTKTEIVFMITPYLMAE